MSQHFDILGYLYLALGLLVLLGGLMAGCALGLGGGLATFANPDLGDQAGIAALFAGIGTFVFLIVALFGALYLAAGYGLLKRQPWARVFSIVIGALSLLSIPIGTALGAYTIWALTRPEAEIEFS